MELTFIESAAQQIVGDDSALGVIGAPNSGKTSTMFTAIKEVLAVNPDAKIAILHPNRKVAGRIRNELSLMLGGLSGNIRVQSISAFAFSILSMEAQERGRELPKLVTGPELDTIIREILSDSENKIFTNSEETKLKFEWLSEEVELSDITDNSALRTEFRELITRTAELGLDAAALEDLAVEFNQPVWADGARMIRAYERALATAEGLNSSAAQQFDHARIITAATTALKRKYQDDSEFLINQSQRDEWHWDWVFIDDLQNATLSVLSLLKVLQKDGSRIRYFANPDQGVESYRGGMVWLPKILSRPENQGGLGAQILQLDSSENSSEEYLQFLRRLVSGIYPVGFGGQRKSSAATDGASGEASNASEGISISAHIFKSEAERIRYIADVVQKLQVDKGVSLSDIAIITRGTSNHRRLAENFADLGVRVKSDSIKRPLREIPIIRSLVQLILLSQKFNELSLEEQQEFSTTLAIPEDLSDVLVSVLSGEIFQLTVGQIDLIRRQLWSRFIVAGKYVDEKEFWKDFFTGKIKEEDLNDFPELQKLISLLKLVSTELKSSQTSVFSLWNIWEGLHLSQKFQEQALGSDMQLAKVANENLDALIQLFAVAERMSKRSSEPVGLLELIERVLDQDLGEDTVARLGSAVEAVALVTPTNSVGLRWKHVIIWDLEEGIWPNLRLRNPISHVPELSSVILEKILGAEELKATQSYQEVMSDELRMFLQAVTRGSETLLLTAVADEKTNPSVIFDFLVSRTDEIKTGQLKLQTVENMNLIRDPLVVLGQLRKLNVLKDASDEFEQKLVDYIQRILELVSFMPTPKFLDELGVSDDTPLFDGEVRLSPSRYHSWKQCSLRQVWDMFVGSGSNNQFSLNLGNVVHRFAEKYPDGASSEEVDAWFNKYWGLISYEADKFELVKHEELLRKVLRLCNEYLLSRETKSWVETRATYRIEDEFTIAAFADRIEYDAETDSLTIIDFKTSKKAPNNSDIADHGQLSVYQYLARKGAFKELSLPVIPKNVTAELINVRELQKVKIQTQEELTAEQLELLENNLLTMAKQLRGSEFNPAPGTYCRSCSYSSLCPAVDGKLVYSR
ncbi:MAG: PD-(D/E)XK nuclease family protein [Arcanobacterium sp.]|nr:PD-(D/E)XK nuclease family protein [Arcanobacterium sp.]